MKIYARSKAVLTIAFLCMPFLPAPAFAATQAPAPVQQARPHPSIQVTDHDYNFGKAMQGTRIEHGFTVRNTGQEVLKIEHVRVA